jgi:hypothetical protein
MLNYILSDAGKPEEAFDEDLAEKYIGLRAVLEIAGKEAVIERKWRVDGLRTKVLVDGKPLSSSEFSSHLLTELGIPKVNYPQANPLSERSWPTLGWASLMRHIYRRQNSWTELAAQQPDSEQHACLMQFLGIADKLFPPEFGQLMDRRKKVTALQLAKDQFYENLNQVSRDLLDEKEMAVGVTDASIDTAIARLRAEASSLQERRSILLDQIKESAESTAPRGPSVEPLFERYSNVQAEREVVATQIQAALARVKEMQEYRTRVRDELARLERAKVAGQVFADLKVTHCPACDRPVTNESDGAACYVCRRPYEDTAVSSKGSRQRLDFELDQLRGEQSEGDELATMASAELTKLQERQEALAETARRLEADLRPLRSRAAAILPPEVALSDVTYGRLQEKIQQLERTKRALGRRKEMAQGVEDLEREITLLESETTSKRSEIEFEKAADLLADAMNTYLNVLNSEGRMAWSQQAVSWHLTKSGFQINVGGRSWRKLGGTLTLYFMLAYNYALLTLTRHPGCHYPGLAVLDFPAKLEDGVVVADKENFALEPFGALLRQAEMTGAQVIATGSAFAGLDANRIALSDVWK